MRGVLIPVTGEPLVVHGDWDEPADIYAVVGGREFELIEIAALTPDSSPLSVYFDADAKYEHRPANKAATALVGGRIFSDDFIAGPALIAAYDKATGDATDLSPLEIVQIGALLVRAERAALE